MIPAEIIRDTVLDSNKLWTSNQLALEAGVSRGYAHRVLSVMARNGIVKRIFRCSRESRNRTRICLWGSPQTVKALDD